MCESLDSDSEEDSQQKDSFHEMDEPIHMDNNITTIGEHDMNASEIMDQEAIENLGMNKSYHNAETAEEAEGDIRGMNNQDKTENSKKHKHLATCIFSCFVTKIEVNSTI